MKAYPEKCTDAGPTRNGKALKDAGTLGTNRQNRLSMARSAMDIEQRGEDRNSRERLLGQKANYKTRHPALKRRKSFCRGFTTEAKEGSSMSVI